MLKDFSEPVGKMWYCTVALLVACSSFRLPQCHLWHFQGSDHSDSFLNMILYLELEYCQSKSILSLYSTSCNSGRSRITKPPAATTPVRSYWHQPPIHSNIEGNAWLRWYREFLKAQRWWFPYFLRYLWPPWRKAEYCVPKKGHVTHKVVFLRTKLMLSVFTHKKQ